ncbi:unnamed protein product [Ambrosiozyma monospora]|uniref:Unnamed protein product n=1 Tax=Ambrosiozyma monospora TaxID=43982 RepID=A0A9W6Z7K5_AMBMO|nr:unnamed protein product [Ambrosiozyma monospora]
MAVFLPTMFILVFKDNNVISWSAVVRFDFPAKEDAPDSGVAVGVAVGVAIVVVVVVVVVTVGGGPEPSGAFKFDPKSPELDPPKLVVALVILFYNLKFIDIPT